MKIGVIAGNRSLPLVLTKRIKEQNPDCEIIVFAFKGETSPKIKKYADKVIWLRVGQLLALAQAIQDEATSECIMIGQINPMNIFKRKFWDNELKRLVLGADFRPHTIFAKIISYLEGKGVKFLDSTFYLKDDLADEGFMNPVKCCDSVLSDIDFGLRMVWSFVELDVGQTIVVKNNSVLALESLEGTDNTIKRASKLSGKGASVFKFCKSNQDLRFDVAVVGITTLKLLKKAKMSTLVLEVGKVIIIDKKRFLDFATKYQISVIGSAKINS